ncbi:PIG-L deacetylase family protein [Marinicrinis sediminis]|uniref:PIG-L deacetylase family protein n=1 Tax=Marinicrinis sediminis TaxID=1652465 RepID=A0ABW5R7I8_9BACL
MMKINNLMVVAHPDDECIFGGHALLIEKGWKVICLTNGTHPVRSVEYKKVMTELGVSYEMWNYPDLWGGDFDRNSLKQKLTQTLNNQSYQKIVTHNLNGEYGHSQHRALSEIMHELVRENLFVFGTSHTMLPYQIIQKKIQLLSYYRSQADVIRTLHEYIQYEKIIQVN